MANVKRILCALVAVAMLFALAACGGDTSTTSSVETSSVGKTSSTGGQVLPDAPVIDETLPGLNSVDETIKTGVRLDSNGNLLYRPEDVGELDNPIVTSLIAPAPDDAYVDYCITWKEEAYGLEYDYDICSWADRDAKWVAAYVGGDAYDIIIRSNFPTTAVKGLLEPLDLHLPTNDTRYFDTPYTWKDHVYGISVLSLNYDFKDVSELHGVWYNADLFEDNGVTTPLELWENGEWTFDKFLETAEALTLDTDRDGLNDIWGWASWVKHMFTIGNGAKTLELTRDNIKLLWNTPAYINGLEYLVNALPYYQSNGGEKSFIEGKNAMWIERIQHAPKFSHDSPNCQINFEAVWVPFPKGPDGEGYLGLVTDGAEIQCIGKGSKNIEGAKVWICADLIKYEYVNDEDAPNMVGVSQEMLDRALTCSDKTVFDFYSKIGSLEKDMTRFWNDVPVLGPKAAIEKWTPSFEGQIDIVLKDTKVE